MISSFLVSPRRSMVSILALSAGLLVAGCAEEPAPPEVGLESASPVAPGAPSGAGNQAGAPATSPAEDGVAARREEIAKLRRPFWHDQEVVTLLGLSEDQLSVMETRRQAKLDERRAARIEATEKRRQLAAALEAGEWGEARRLGGEIGALSAAAPSADTELKVSILELLSAEQRQQLVRERPSALRRSWLLPGPRRPQGRENPLLDGRGQ